MDLKYAYNYRAQITCYKLSSGILKSICKKIIKLGNDTINIAFFGGGIDDNDFLSFKQYMLPYIRSKYIFNKIEIYMIDIINTKWTNKRQSLGNNIYISGYTYDIYKQIFIDNYLDIVLSYNCLNWFGDIKLYKTKFKDKYCWSFLDIEEKTVIKNIVNKNLNLFLKARKNELNQHGQILITTHGNDENDVHQFQKTNETFSYSLKCLSRKLSNKNIFSNFFIKTCPQSVDDIKNIVDNVKLKNELITIKKANCVFLENSYAKNDKYSRIEYANGILQSFMPSVLVSLKNNINGFNSYLETKLREEFFNTIFYNNLEESSTDGSILIIYLKKLS